MDETKKMKRGDKVTTWNGLKGTIRYRTKDGWYGVHIEGERTVSGKQRVDEWQAFQLTK